MLRVTWSEALEFCNWAAEGSLRKRSGSMQHGVVRMASISLGK